MDKQEIIKYFMEKGVLIGPDFFENLGEEFDSSTFFNSLNGKVTSKPLVINKDVVTSISNTSSPLDLNWRDFDVARTSYEKANSDKVYQQFVGSFSNSSNTPETTSILIDETTPAEIKNESELGGPQVKILFSYEYKNKKKEVQDFVNYFKKRYESLKKILSNRQELQESVSIARLARKQEGEVASIIGLIVDKSVTKNGNIKFVLEDPTGVHQVLVTKNKEEIFNMANDLVLDEVIGVTGVLGNKILFCNGIYFPDIPINHELKKSPDEAYAVFISDIHFGIKNFLTGDFMKFVLWLKGEYGNEQQRDIASKVHYLFLTGDIVEGVGIYPGQEEDLEIKDVYAQYEEATRYLKMIPERIKMIMCGGNHDAMRMSEPQPIFDKNISKGFFEIPNLVMVTNPALINIHSSKGFPGFDVLMYHGGSFPYFADNVPSIRDKGGIVRCDLIMKFLLQRRHLAPSHSSTLYVPDETMDPLVIEKVPDIFVSGHIHQITVGNYRNVSTINSSCWVLQSEDNAKRGIVPHPGKIPIINLKTREVRIMNFLDDSVKVLFTERAGLK